jgi:hypothetical protein
VVVDGTEPLGIPAQEDEAEGAVIGGDEIAGCTGGFQGCSARFGQKRGCAITVTVRLCDGSIQGMHAWVGWW